MDKIVVGIDLGTTFSAVAYVNEQGRPEAIRNADGKTTTPSVVLVEGGRCAVGEVALNQWVTNEEHVVRWIKRAMGDDGYRFQGMSAVELSAEILKALKADAEVALGAAAEEAVITCPAYFSTNEIENTKKAGELAGFRVREIVKEPTAAAVYYGVEQMSEGETVLVCDLGGGTYDATVMTYRGGSFEPLASMGDRQLGGHDWTMELVDLAAERFRQALGEDPRDDLVAGQMLYEACEQAKRDFARQTEVIIPCHHRGRMEQQRVTRDEFEARTEWRVHALVMWSERALEKAGLSWRGVDRVLLVGGSSRLRRMGLALEEASGKQAVRTGEPNLMVAYGAAILARGKVRPRRAPGGLVEAPAGGLVEVDYKRIIARALGTRIIVFEGAGARLTNELLIPHSTESPVSRSRSDFEVSSDVQEQFDVPVVEFESDEEFDVVGNYRFRCPPGAKRGDRIKVTFSYDISGIVSVEAEDVKTGRALAGDRLPYEEPDLSQVSRVAVRPRWVVFAVDTSYSMEGEKMNEAKKAVVGNAEELLRVGGEQCRVGIVSFDTQAQIVCRPTSDLAALRGAVAGMHPNGATAMDEGIRQAVELVLGAPAGTDRDVVLLTDGMPDPHRRDSTQVAAEEARRRGVTLSTLGVSVHQGDVDLAYLQTLTPLSLVIEGVDGVAQAMTTLLTKSVAARGGLRDV